MEKINFQNGITPLNDTNLNQLQDNMEEIGVVVNPTQPTTNEKVWLQKGKNLFNIFGSYTDNDTFRALANMTRTKNSLTLEATSGASGFMIFNKKYNNNKCNLSFNMSSGEKSRILLKPLNLNDELITSLSIDGWTYLEFYGAYYKETTEANISIPIELSSDVISFRLGFVAVGYTINNIQLEIGEVATEYEEYIDKKIYCKNDNGVFEEFVNVETMEIETITNNNGIAIKFPDGRMECNSKKDTVTIQKGQTSVSIEFPVAFVEAPTVLANFYLHNGVGYPVSANLGYSVSKTGITFYTDVAPTGTNYVLNYIARGRWK